MARRWRDFSGAAISESIPPGSCATLELKQEAVASRRGWQLLKRLKKTTRFENSSSTLKKVAGSPSAHLTLPASEITGREFAHRFRVEEFRRPKRESLEQVFLRLTEEARKQSN